MGELACLDLGRAAYGAVLDLQRRLVAEVQARDEGAWLLLVEHDPPVITFGRRRRPEHLLASRERLAAGGVDVVETARGGDVTYHGPGQLVAYPILRLNRRRRTVHGHVRSLEEAVLRLLEHFGLAGERRQGLTGVWVGRQKVAAIGVAVERWVTYHGLALNVSADLAGFDLIVPCGLHGQGVTSLSRLLGRDVTVDEAKPVLTRCLADCLGFESVRPTEPPGREAAPAGRLPQWLRRRPPTGPHAQAVKSIVSDLGLHTVCAEARCPNLAECFARRTATFLILGDRCTRSCRFCAVSGGPPLPVRGDEPHAVAEAAARMDLRHVVVTSVTRDDLPDGGAGHFAAVVRAVRRRLPKALVEILTPDFRGDGAAIDAALSEPPDVYNHNVETVPRLYPPVRPQADYRRSLGVLDHVRRQAAAGGLSVVLKSGLMVGLGETREEIRHVMGDLRAAGCDVLTVGQYLAPTPRHHPVRRFVEPDEFAEIRREALTMGFRAVAAGPFVRSSYRAEGLLQTIGPVTAGGAVPGRRSPPSGTVPVSRRFSR